MVVNNKPGAGGITGAAEAAGARPDGSTVMITSAGSFLLTSMLQDTPVSPLEDYEIVAQIGDLDPAILVPAGSPYEDLEGLVSALRVRARAPCAGRITAWAARTTWPGRAS